jgi:hypothetical protein
MLCPMKRVVAAAVAALAVGAGTAGASNAATPCWQAVQNDWLQHGQVVHRYKLPCYLTAIKNLPADAATYGGAAADIRRAYLNEKKRLAALAKKQAAAKAKAKAKAAAKAKAKTAAKAKAKANAKKTKKKR